MSGADLGVRWCYEGKVKTTENCLNRPVTSAKLSK